MQCQFSRDAKERRKTFARIIRELSNSATELQEGDKVKFNLKFLQDDEFWGRMRPERRQFVEDHAEDVFTVQYDVRHQNFPSVVCLKEDTSEEKWLFSDAELCKVDAE